MSDKLDMASPDLVSKNIEQIAALFPNCVTETADGKAIDFDLLRQELSGEIVEGTKERTVWSGRARKRRLLQRTSLQLKPSAQYVRIQ